MALSLGSLFVKLSADPSELVKGMDSAADKVAKFGNKLNEISGKLGALGVSLAAIGAGAIRLASQFDSQVKGATDNLSNSFAAVSVEVGRALLPVINLLTQAFATLAGYLRSVDPETKALVAGFAAATAGTLTLVAGVGKVVSAFTSLAPVISGALGPIVPAMLPVVAVVAAIALAVPLLWQAWKENFGNIQGFTTYVVDVIVEKWNAFKGYFSRTVSFLGSAWETLTGFLWSSWSVVMKGVASLAGSVAKAFGADWTMELDAFNETIDDIAKRGFGGLVEDAVDGATIVGKAWMEGASDIGRTLKDKVGGAIKGVFDEYGKGLDKLKALPGAVAGKTEKKKPQVMMMEEIIITGNLPTIADRIGEGMKAAGDSLIASMGEVGQLVSSFAQTMTATGDPLIALTKVFAELVMKTESFSKLMDNSLKLLGSIVNLLDKLFGWLFDLLGTVFDAISNAIDAVAEFIDPRPNQLEVPGGLKEIEILPPKQQTDILEPLTDAATEAAKALNKLNESITNVPAGFRLAAARFNATRPDVMSIQSGRGQPIEVSVNLDGRRFAKTVNLVNVRDYYINTGGLPPPTRP